MGDGPRKRLSTHGWRINGLAYGASCATWNRGELAGGPGRPILTTCRIQLKEGGREWHLTGRHHR